MSATTAERPEIAIPERADTSPHLGVRPDRERAPLTAEREPNAKRRKNLLFTGSAIAVVVLAAGGVFYIGSHRSHVLRTTAITGALPTPVAAAVPPTSTPAAVLARAPLPTKAAPLPAIPSGDGDDMAAFLKAGGHPQATNPAPVIAPNAEASEPQPAGPAHADTSSATTPSAVEPRQLAPLPPAQHAQIAQAETASASPAKVEIPAAPVAAAPLADQATATTRSAADVAAHLTPGKMTDAEQIQVLDLVTKLGTLVRNQDIRIADLQSTVSGLQGRVDTSLTDFGRRLTLAEATGAVNSAAAAPASLPGVAVPRPLEPATAVAARVVVHPRSTLSPASDSATHRYHVQAASPGLAMLSELDAAGGEEEQIPVAPGDVVPGYGKVISISQRGSSWVVKAQNGLIQ